MFAFLARNESSFGLSGLAGRLALLMAAGGLCLSAGEWSRTYKIVGPPELRAEANDAVVKITAWDRDEIAVHVTTSGWKISETEVRVLENRAGNVTELRVMTPKLSFGFNKKTVKVEIQVPRETGCEIRAGFGNVSIEGVKGRMVVNSARGRLDATGIDGKLEATTGEGKVQVSGRLDLLTIRSGFGAVNVDAAAGSRMFSGWRISTDDGNITLRVPQAFTADLDSRTESGKITVELPYTITGTPDQASIKGKLNGGGEPLLLRTSGGNIKILANQ